MRNAATNRVQVGRFLVDLYTHEIRKDGTRIRLIGQPFDILSVLLSRPGELVTREELRMRLWPGDTFVDFDHGLNAAVNKLRETLSDSADNPRFVETLPRRGYRFIANVERLDARNQSAGMLSIAEHAANVPANCDAAQPRVSSKPELAANSQRETSGASGRLKLWLSPILVAAVLLLVFFATNTRNKGPREALANAPASPMRMLAFTGPDEDAWQPAFSPDGKRIAFARWGTHEDSGIFVKQVGSDSQTQLTRDGHDRSPAWSSEGNTIAFSRWNDP